MLRLLGCLMLIITGSLCGIVKSRALKEHTRELKTVCSMLREISEMIRYERSTTEEIFHSLQCTERYNILTEKGVSSLTEDEHLLLERILSGLGTTDAEGQISMIAHGLSRFTEYADSAYEKQKTDCRLYEVLGFMGGTFLAVMFI